MRIFPHRGMPARGSFQERVLQEMLLREQRCRIAVESYHGHLLAAGLGISKELFSLWTDNLTDEITHNNYDAATIERKRRALRIFEERHSTPRLGLARANKYTVKRQEDLLPYTKEEIAKIKSKVRAKSLETNLQHGIQRTEPRQKK